MNLSHKTGLTFLLALIFSLPIQATAAETGVSTEAAAAQPMSSMQDLMRDMRGDQDPSKCKTMKGAAADQDSPAAMPGMGMGMQGENCKQVGRTQGPGKPCMMGGHYKCAMHAGANDQRLDALEKRMDMMQMMMEMMMRQSGGGN